ncbi:MAG: dipicolinate synthase subunit B [Syntrophomonadaceae bacterium]|nr:dipicolinate synthase subunit B [Syntrophomonadaceae bacterium]
MPGTRFSNLRVGAVLTGSHCTMDEVLPQLQRLRDEGAELVPILSYTVSATDNRFYPVAELKDALRRISGTEIITTITGAEPIGPRKLLDIVVVMPATGNTIAKMANGIADTPSLMAVKAQLRNQRPVVVAISTNDALGVNARNIGALMNMKDIYFVPFGQDDPEGKPRSLVANMELVGDTILAAMTGRQLQPMVLGPIFKSH